MIKDVAIYGERCPEGLLRYVGKSNNPRKRQMSHLSEARRGAPGHHYNWLRSLSKPPELELLARAPADAWEDAERYWIALARDYGCALTNLTDGGDGGPSLLGRKATPEARHNMCLAQAKVLKTPEQLERITSLNKGKPFSEEHRHKLSLAHLGKKQTPQQIQNALLASFRRGPRKDSTTRLKGVTPSFGKFTARAYFNKGTQNLGTYKTAEAAARAVDFAVLRYQPIGSWLNYPFIPEPNE